MSIGLAQVKAQLEALPVADTRSRVVAIRTAKPIADATSIERRGHRFDLRWCATPLALREALVEHERRTAEDPDGPGLIVLTPIEDFHVPDDVRGRLARARIFEVRGWQVALDLFEARHVDARLARLDWMPDALAEASAAGFVEPSGTGFLDQELAWTTLVRHRLGLDSARPDACALMVWSLRPDAADRLSSMPKAMRADLFAWWQVRGDPALAAVLRALQAGFLGEIAPLGFVCDVLFAPAATGNTGLIQAATRLERYVDGRALGAREGEAWAGEAGRLSTRLDADALRSVLASAERLLREIRAEEFAGLSRWLPSGFERRVQAFASAAEQALDDPSDRGRADTVEKALAAVKAHRTSADHPERVERVEMAARLLRWLQEGVTESNELSICTIRHADQDAWADWARFRLLGGDEVPSLSRLFGRLRSVVAERRERSNREFAEAMARSAGTPHQHPRVIPVEDVLGKVLAPLAAQHRNVLLLVVDGLSVAIHRELFAALHRQGWAECVREDSRAPLVGLAMLPTVTEISRCSLLAGRRLRGNSGTEKPAFAAHDALLSVSASGRPPKLFHKGELAVDGELSPGLRAAIEDPQQRVVGIVHNAVDDHLSGPEQLNHRWSLDSLRLLLPILRATLDAGRVLVVTADHGHVLEDGSALVEAGAMAPRWRAAGKPAGSGEILLKGPRVLPPEGEGAIVCLWSEKQRYTGRQTGYHGGVSPAEVLVPLSVYAPADVNLPGHVAAPPLDPMWWREAQAPTARPRPADVATAAASGRPSRRKPAEALGQPQLFEAPPPPDPATAADWISRLLSSPVYAQQRQLAARVRQSDEEMRKLLTALAERGGKLGRAALAQQVGIAEMRLGGFLTSARRLLNVDQSPVLGVDDLAGVVELNLPLLAQQFGVQGVPGVRG